MQITHFKNIRVPEHRVVIDIEFCIEREHISATGQDQRIDLGERSIGFNKSLIQPLQGNPRLRQRCLGNADLARDIVRL